MAISTVASDQARYKKMITDWLVSFALVFLLHYIIIIALNVNNGLVSIFKGIMDNLPNSSNSISSYEKLASSLVKKSFIGTASVTWAAAICYAILVGVTAAFLFSYIKRMLTVGFLIMIAPIITITYSIDRVGDGKAQALNTWLREFLLNVLIQPFHCLIYLVFANAAVSLIYSSGWSSVSGMILAIMCMLFIWPAEKIVKEIFGFKQSSTLTDTVASLAAISAMGKMASEAAGKAAKNGGRFSRNINRVVNNNPRLSNMRQSFNNAPGIRQLRQLNQNIQNGKNSTNLVTKAASHAADAIGKTAMNPALGGAIAFTAMSAGANQQTSLNTGIEAYKVGSSIRTSLAERNKIPQEVQEGENRFRDMLEQYSHQIGFENYKTNQAEYQALTQEVERLLGTSLNTLESRIQMMLNAYVTSQGYDLNNPNDVSQLATDMNNLATQDLNTLTQGTAEYNLARAIQEKELASRTQVLSGIYQGHGVTDTRAAITEVLDRIQDDTFDDGSGNNP